MSVDTPIPQVADPPLVQLIRWIGNPIEYLRENQQKYGSWFTFVPFKLPPLVIVSDPEAVQQIFNLDGKGAFNCGASNHLLLPLVGEKSLFLSDGDRHRRERKLLMPPFHGERLQGYGAVIQKITADYSQAWSESGPLIARQLMQDITLEIIIQVVFGLREGERYQAIKPLLAQILDTTDSPLSSAMIFFKFLQQDWGPGSPWGKMVRSRKKLYQILQEEIQTRREQPQLLKEDVLSLMMQATDAEGQGMSNAEIQDQLMSLLIAGHETTATSLAWAFYLLGQNLEVKEKLIAEIDSSNPQDLAKLPYLQGVCQETLRMYPVVPIATPRTPKEPVAIGGYTFDSRVALAPCIQLVHYRPEIYPEPDKFQPERFLDRQYDGGEYLPFGGGNRRCLGYAFALLEFKLVLGKILQSYDPQLVSLTPIAPKRRGITLVPPGGVLLRMEKRNRSVK